MRDRRREQFSPTRKEAQRRYQEQRRAKERTERCGQPPRFDNSERLYQKPRLRDFRSREERRSDRELSGTWWRCPEHGLTDAALVLGVVPYCPEWACAHQLLVAHSAESGTDESLSAKQRRRRWNDGGRERG